MNRRFAQSTSVPVERSKAEIEGLLARYGATAFVSGWRDNYAQIQFDAQGRRIRFTLPLPDPTNRKFTTSPTRGKVLPPEAARKNWEQACRQSWRALALVVKAKLEAVAAGISEFENEFLANIVLPDGGTVGERTRPQIALMYESGSMTPLLEAPRH